MSKDVTPPNPRDFGIASFADLLSTRPPIPGEVPGGFDAFRAGMLASLTPITPYECVVAENLVAIEWELFQRRRMREAYLRNCIRKSITKSAMHRAEELHDDATEQAIDDAWDAHVDAGGDEEDWENPFPFDRDASRDRVDALTEGALSNDPQSQATAYQTLTEMGVSLADLMGDAYAEAHGPGQRHDAKIQELERRRREVMRDYTAVQKARPIDPVKTDGYIEDAELVQT